MSMSDLTKIWCCKPAKNLTLEDIKWLESNVTIQCLLRGKNWLHVHQHLGSLDVFMIKQLQTLDKIK